MPFIAPFIAPLITAAIGGTELGMNLAGVGQPSPGDAAKQLEKQKEQQAQQDALAKQKMIQAALPNAQEQSGGTLDTPSLTDLGAIIAGLPGEANTGAGRGALSSYLGLGPTQTQQPGNLVSATYGAGLTGSQEG